MIFIPEGMPNPNDAIVRLLAEWDNLATKDREEKVQVLTLVDIEDLMVAELKACERAGCYPRRLFGEILNTCGKMGRMTSAQFEQILPNVMAKMKQ